MRRRINAGGAFKAAHEPSLFKGSDFVHTEPELALRA
jgi:uncharacterized protein with PIN domain